jgi:hypothetical protein
VRKTVTTALEFGVPQTADEVTTGRPDFTEVAVRAMINESERAGTTLADALLADGAASLAPRRR